MTNIQFIILACMFSALVLINAALWEMARKKA